MTTFATNTINNSQSNIDAIQQQIAELQKRLTETQASHQQILGAEQKGLSAMQQYKEAIAAIAALNEPDMLSAFLSEMAAITGEALGERASEFLPEAPEASEAVTNEPEPKPPEGDGTNETDRKLSNHPWKSGTGSNPGLERYLGQSNNAESNQPEPKSSDDGTNKTEPATEQVKPSHPEPKPAKQLELQIEPKPDNNIESTSIGDRANSESKETEPQSYKDLSWKGIRKFCKSHDLKTGGGRSRNDIEDALFNAGYKPSDITQWLSSAA